MPNFQNEETLVEVLRTLAEHRNESKTFYRALLDLQVRRDDEHNLLRDVFATSVSDRRSASLKRGQQAVADFDNIGNLFGTSEQEIEDDPETAHLHLFEGLCKLQNIDQKIAAVTLKLVVVYLKQWQELLPYLFVPVDRVVLKISRDKLRVYIGPWKQAPSIKKALYVNNGTRPCSQYRKFLEFQEELGHICSRAGEPRILADELWFIGHVFCKEFPLCNRCWIKQWCQSPINAMF